MKRNWRVMIIRLTEPTLDPSQEGSKQSNARRQFPSWEGSGVGFMLKRSQ